MRNADVLYISFGKLVYRIADSEVVGITIRDFVDCEGVEVYYVADSAYQGLFCFEAVFQP